MSIYSSTKKNKIKIIAPIWAHELQLPVGSYSASDIQDYGKLLLDTATEKGPYTLNTATKKVLHKRAEEAGEFLRNKIANKIVKPKPWPWLKFNKCWRNSYSTKEKTINIKQIKTSIIKSNTIKCLNYPSYAWNIFGTLLHEMSHQELTKGNTQLTRQNDFSVT